MKSLSIAAAAALVVAAATAALLLSDLRRDGAGIPPPALSGEFRNFTVIDPPRPVPEIRMVGGPIGGADREMGFEEWRGKVVLLNFWATWCAPCLREMPALARLQAEMAGPDFAVITLSVDRGGRKVVEPWLEEHGLAALGVHLDHQSRIFRAMGVRGLPTTFIIDREGRAVGGIEGPAEWDSDEAKALIRHYLSAE